ncbi:MAG: class I SAM-dependent methyltransferase [Chloroflexota bacterium]|nr:class I SAM-dependent methyltransferase [Chloroflexota bacterium]
MSDVLYTMGNTAKLYCLNWLSTQLAQNSEQKTILDLGCGTGQNFVQLLRDYPHVQYVGIEPSAAACAEARKQLAGTKATIIQDYAYHAVHSKLPQPTFDFIVSFSVFEHVYRRQHYLEFIRTCLKPDGYVLINYDAGHFQSHDLKERLKNVIGPVLARLGNEAYYQSFVREADFRRWAGEAQLEIIEAKSFNTALKGVYKQIPDSARSEYMQRWLEMETWLNNLSIPYDDRKATVWYTRNFILRAR